MKKLSWLDLDQRLLYFGHERRDIAVAVAWRVETQDSEGKGRNVLLKCEMLIHGQKDIKLLFG